MKNLFQCSLGIAICCAFAYFFNPLALIPATIFLAAIIFYMVN